MATEESLGSFGSRGPSEGFLAAQRLGMTSYGEVIIISPNSQRALKKPPRELKARREIDYGAM
jgi:hypothetical protein